MKTVLTYSHAFDAEVDKSMLTADGIAVNLLNTDSSLSGLGGPFLVQLQVDESEFGRAVALIKSKRPERFGRNENIRDAEAAIGRGARRFFWFVASSIALLFLLELIWNPNKMGLRRMIGANIVGGTFISIPAWLLYELFRKLTRKANRSPEPVLAAGKPPAGREPRHC